jgi:hypothetical protein
MEEARLKRWFYETCGTWLSDKALSYEHEESPLRAYPVV